MIHLDELVLENFISHKITTIEMEDLSGLIMVDGHNIGGKYDSNGAGKSTILEGIVYNLTGETLRKMGVNGMVNRKVGKDTRTSSKLRAQGKTIQIDRYRKHDQFGDQIVMTEDGTDVSKRLNKETQGMIDSMLGISHRILTSTIFLGEGLSSKFTQLGDGDKKSLIESTLNLPYDFGKSRDEANAKLKEVQRELASAKGQITSLEGVIADLDRDTLTAKVADLTAQIQGIQASKSVKDTEYADLYKQYEVLNQQRMTLTTESNNLNHQLSQQKVIMDEVARLKQLWADAGSTGACVVCKQVSADAVHNAQAHYMTELQAKGQTLGVIMESVGSMRSAEDIQRDFDETSKSLSDLSPEMQRLHAEIQGYASDISRMTADVNAANDLLQNADKYEKDIENLKVSVESYVKEEEIYKYWYNAFSPQGLMVKVLEEAVEYLNDRVELYSEMLLDRKYKMSLDKGKLSLVDSDGASYETLSNGEKRRLDLAIQFGLHDYVHTYCGLQIDTLFIDEVLDTLDAVGISNIIDILRIKLGYCGLSRIFVITHNQDLKSYFDRVLLVSKDAQGFSSLQII